MKNHKKDRPDVLSRPYIEARVDKEIMNEYNNDLKKLKSKSLSMFSLEKLVETCDLKYKRGTFKNKEGKERKQVYLGHWHRERGEFVDEPEDGAFAPPQRFYVMPFGLASWVPVHPKDMVKHKDPLESVLFPRKGTKDYDETYNARLEKALSFLENIINEERCIYLAEHEHEFGYYPTTKFDSAEHLKQKLIDALDDESMKLAERRSLTYLSRPILFRDEKRNYDDKPDLRPSRDQVEKMRLFEKYYTENPDCKDRVPNLLAVGDIRTKWESSFEMPSNPDHLPDIMEFNPMHHYDRTGKEIPRDKVSKYLRGKDCIVAPVIHIKPMTVKPKFMGGPRSRHYKEDPNKKEFKHVTLPVSLHALYWLGNGKNSTGRVEPTAELDIRRRDDEAEFEDGEEEEDDDDDNKGEDNEHTHAEEDRKHGRDDTATDEESGSKRAKSEDGDNDDSEPPSTQADIVNTEDMDNSE